MIFLPKIFFIMSIIEKSLYGFPSSGRELDESTKKTIEGRRGTFLAHIIHEKNTQKNKSGLKKLLHASVTPKGYSRGFEGSF